ncbi:MAG: hypothetical protein AAFO93_06505 [Pseudomonadota bacterium]
MSDTPLIFSHFGNSWYLRHTLALARQTNPNRRLVLLGDKANRNVALKNGWEHAHFADFRAPSHDSFDAHFRMVEGPDHKSYKGKVNWLRYVFERWYHIEGFAAREGIDRFWHFDTDTMILRDLSDFEPELAHVDFTVQCNNTCLNGIVSTAVLREFNLHTIDIFKDTAFLDEEQRKLDTEHPNWSFNEMMAFKLYKAQTTRPWLHLMAHSDTHVFDDAIRQEHGFDTTPIGCGITIKDVFARNGRVFGTRLGDEVELVTLNMSWMPRGSYKWVRRAARGEDGRLADAVRFVLKLHDLIGAKPR